MRYCVLKFEHLKIFYYIRKFNIAIEQIGHKKLICRNFEN